CYPSSPCAASSHPPALLFLLPPPPPPRPTLFPYTTLFRSLRCCRLRPRSGVERAGLERRTRLSGRLRLPRLLSRHRLRPRLGVRSEEHTSELQSRENLVCRLLLEKKKKSNIELISEGVRAD